MLPSQHGLYEGGHRVPTIARWTGRIAAGTTTDETAMTIDVFPTLLEVADLATLKKQLSLWEQSFEK